MKFNLHFETKGQLVGYSIATSLLWATAFIAGHLFGKTVKTKLLEKKEKFKTDFAEALDDAEMPE